MCCLMRSRATLFSAPRGIITSAYFFVGILGGSGNQLIRVESYYLSSPELLKCRFDEAGVLVEDMLQVPASLRDVP